MLVGLARLAWGHKKVYPLAGKLFLSIKFVFSIFLCYNLRSERMAKKE